MINTDGSASRITLKLKKNVISLRSLWRKSATEISAFEGNYSRIRGSIYRNAL